MALSPLLLGITLVRPIFRIGRHLDPLPSFLPLPLAGGLATIFLLFDPGICRNATPAARTDKHPHGVILPAHHSANGHRFTEETEPTPERTKKKRQFCKKEGGEAKTVTVFTQAMTAGFFTAKN